MQILYNAKIITLFKDIPLAEALVIRENKIIALGTSAEILTQFGDLHLPGEITEKFDMQGKTVIPGLTDAHIHFELFSRSISNVDCETETYRECLDRVASRVSTTPPGNWICGHGWNQNVWAGGYGTAIELDEVAPNNPVYLTAKSLHASWANSKALQMAGINENTLDPPGGQIQRDISGKPTGILFESAAFLVEKVVAVPSPEELSQILLNGQECLLRYGITGIHDFDRSSCFSALQILHQNHELKVRVVKNLPYEDLPPAIAMGLRSGFGDDHIRIGNVKLFSDGALGPRTAAMIGDYENEPGNKGSLLIDAEELFEIGKTAVDHGFGLAVHAIGDYANHEILNGYEQLRQYEKGINLKAKIRHRIEHVQLIHADDASRLAQLDVIASMQPIHATSDMDISNRYWGKRSNLAYAWKTQLDAKATLAFGSDAPVESPNPFWGIHAAVTRRRIDGSLGKDGWYPEQRISVLEAIKAYTTGAAKAASLENSQGMLAPGFQSDLLVLDKDPFICDPEELHDIHPIACMVGGEWIFKEI